MENIENMTMESMQTKVLEKYDKYMYLKVYVDYDLTDSNEEANEEAKALIKIYETAIAKHNHKVVTQLEHVDAGFDLYNPSTLYLANNCKQVKVDFKVICSAQIHTHANKRNTGYYMYPRSSLSKTNLRLANSTGIIDSGYRGHIMGIFDVINSTNPIHEHERLVQICAPSLNPILVELVKTKEELGMQTVRGDGGFGSTGK